MVSKPWHNFLCQGVSGGACGLILTRPATLGLHLLGVKGAQIDTIQFLKRGANLSFIFVLNGQSWI